VSILSYVNNLFIFKWLLVRTTFLLILLEKLFFTLLKPWHGWYIANYSSQYWHNYNSKVNYYDIVSFRTL